MPTRGVRIRMEEANDLTGLLPMSAVNVAIVLRCGVP
jgi:hypothetical protein